MNGPNPCPDFNIAPQQIFVKEVIRKLKDNMFESPHHSSLAFSLLTPPDKVCSSS